MEILFATAELAALCNSARQLAERWGDGAGSTIGRRLLDLAAIDAKSLALLPGVNVTTASGETIVRFGDVEIRGVIDASATTSTSSRMLIASVGVTGRV